MKPAKENAQPNKSLIDGITILQALAVSERPIGGRELARQLDFDPTRVNRLLKTLAYLGIARQTSDRKYAPGSGMHVLAAQSLFASGLIRKALPALERLRHFNHVVALGVLWRTNVSYLYHAPPGIASAEAMGRIGLYPASKGGIGLALLAEMDDADIRVLYKDESDIPGFPGGLTDLLHALRQIRIQKYARLLVKPVPEQHTVAVTLGQPAHAAIGMSGWIPEESIEVVVQHLRDSVKEIELDDLGSTAPVTMQTTMAANRVTV